MSCGKGRTLQVYNNVGVVFHGEFNSPANSVMVILDHRHVQSGSDARLALPGANRYHQRLLLVIACPYHTRTSFINDLSTNGRYSPIPKTFISYHCGCKFTSIRLSIEELGY